LTVSPGIASVRLADNASPSIGFVVNDDTLLDSCTFALPLLDVDVAPAGVATRNPAAVTAAAGKATLRQHTTDSTERRPDINPPRSTVTTR
jgi:hypothetical protein